MAAQNSSRRGASHGCRVVNFLKRHLAVSEKREGEPMVNLPHPFTVLAPMQEVTDLPFWRTLAQCGGGPELLVTEYFRVHIHSTLEKDILASVLKNPTGRPVITQMIGRDPVEMRRTARQLLEHDEVAGVDINLGCPAPVVCSKQAGGGLC